MYIHTHTGCFESPSTLIGTCPLHYLSLSFYFCGLLCYCDFNFILTVLPLLNRPRKLQLYRIYFDHTYTVLLCCPIIIGPVSIKLVPPHHHRHRYPSCSRHHRRRPSYRPPLPRRRSAAAATNAPTPRTSCSNWGPIRRSSSNNSLPLRWRPQLATCTRRSR